MIKRPTVTRKPFGMLPDGTIVEILTLTNTAGIEVRAITYGGIIVSLATPDRHGQYHDIVLGYETLDGYLNDSPYFGTIVGRYANRIARGEFTLDGVTYRLATNNGPNHLHGGIRGFDKVVWQAETFEHPGRAGIILTHISPDGDEGYPGTLVARVIYTLTDNNELEVSYDARTDKPTPVNLTQHTYFNLAGATRDVLNHELTIMSDNYLPVDSTLIPTGEIARVMGTPFDFRAAAPIGKRIDHTHEQLRHAGGYDHTFVLARQDGTVVHAARVLEPESGRVLDVFTTEPGLQLYSGNFLNGTIRGKGGHVYGPRFGFCLETQHFPDSPNKPHFPQVIVRPDERYESRTVFVFGTDATL